MKRIYQTLLLGLCSTLVLAQNPWREAPTNDGVSLQGVKDNHRPVPTEYRGLSLDASNMRNILQQAMGAASTNVPIPMPDGSFEDFRIIESNVLPPALAAKFPSIKTYMGYSLSDPTKTISLDIGPLGFHALILNSGGRDAVEVYPFENQNRYLSFYKSKAEVENTFQCDVRPFGTVRSNRTGATAAFDFAKIYTYRTAIAATGEYSNYFGSNATNNDKSFAMNGIATTVNNVSNLYRREFSVQLQLIPNNDLLVYLNPATDPYQNDVGSDIDINRTNTTSVIGLGNYDIGHVVTTDNGGGVAYLGVVCDNSNYKAGGATGLAAPEGATYDIDYVAHEMGHQFNCPHNFSAQSCGTSQSGRRYEPGEGTTIMCYAGVCSASDRIQPHSDPYFHAINILDVQSYIAVDGACAAQTASGNNPPVITSLTTTFTIPKSTPFVLAGSATDADNDPLYYDWEQYNGSGGTSSGKPLANGTTNALFKFVVPSTSPARTFPNINDIVNNVANGTTWETLPSVARSLSFRFVVRDQKATGGATVVSNNVTVTVSGTAGPFSVSAPNTAVTWAGGSTQTVTWAVASTSGIAPNVAIELSTDGGLTYPTVLLASTPNDGTQSITVPNVSTTTARIRVRSATSPHFFFDISNVNFAITSAGPTVTAGNVSSPICAGATFSVSFTTTGTFTGGNTFTAQLSDASGSFSSPTDIGSGTSSPISVTIPAGTMAGSAYKIQVVASDAGETVTPSNAFQVNTTPTGTLTGTQAITEGSSANLTLTFAGASPWNYTITNGPSGSTSSTPATISVTPAATTTYTLASVSNACGVGNASGSATVTVNPAPPTVTTGSVSSPVCAGATFSLSFTKTGTFTGGNTFTAQLSNASGSFSTPVDIGSGTTSPISVTIPAGTTAGSSYKIQVVASDAGETVTPSNAFQVNVKPTGTLTGTQAISAGASANLTLTLTGASPWNYTITNGPSSSASSSPATVSVTPAATTTYTLASVSNACGVGMASGSATVTVNAVQITFQLWKAGNANNRQYLRDLNNGDVIALSGLPSNVTIYAVPAGSLGTVRSIRIGLTGAVTKSKLDDASPFTLYGDNAGFAPVAGAYNLRGRTYNNVGGTGTPSADRTIDFTFSSSARLASNEDMNDEIWKTYPNPFRDIITLELPESMNAAKVSVSVINLTGHERVIERENLSAEGNSLEINTRPMNLHTGIYFLKVASEEKIKVMKVMKVE